MGGMVANSMFEGGLTHASISCGRTPVPWELDPPLQAATDNKAITHDELRSILELVGLPGMLRPAAASARPP